MYNDGTKRKRNNERPDWWLENVKDLWKNKSQLNRQNYRIDIKNDTIQWAMTWSN